MLVEDDLVLAGLAVVVVVVVVLVDVIVVVVVVLVNVFARGSTHGYVRYGH